jgi:hypothetical protein
MRPTMSPHDLNFAGVILLGGALLVAEAGWLHMRGLTAAYGKVCGSPLEMLAHCPACYVSPILLTLGVACLVLAQAIPGGATKPVRLRR